MNDYCALAYVLGVYMYMWNFTKKFQQQKTWYYLPLCMNIEYKMTPLHQTSNLTKLLYR